jgi:hypothetical protein
MSRTIRSKTHAEMSLVNWRIANRWRFTERINSD